LDIDNRQRLRKVPSGCFTRLLVATCEEVSHSAGVIVESEKEKGERNGLVFQ